MRFTYPRATALGVVVLAVAACALRDEDSASDESNASEGHYVQGNSPFFWAESTYPDFLEVSASIGAEKQPEALVDGNVIAVRLQAWVDRFDAVVRREMAQRFPTPLVAPKPIVKVLPTRSTFNAWVSPVIGCIGGLPEAGTAPIDAGNAEAGDAGAASVPTVTYASENGIWAGVPYACVSPPSWASVPAFEKLWNGARARCKVDTSGGNTWKFSGDQCGGAGTYPLPISMVAASPYIHVTSDLVAALDETTVAVVLAHELGHYYRSHVSSLVQRKYDFWFDVDPTAPRRPVPSAEAAAFAAAYKDIVSGPKPVAEAALKGRYSPRLRQLLVGPIASALSSLRQNNPTVACANVKAGMWTTQLLFNGSVPDESVRSSFVAFEDALAACGDALKVASYPDESELDLGGLLIAADYRALGSPRIPDHTTLTVALGILEKAASDIDKKASNFLADVQTNRVGLYTTEQEADEMALDVATKAGIAPDAVIGGWLDFMRAGDASGKAAMGAAYDAYLKQTGDLTESSCRALLTNDFSDVDASGNRTPHVMVIGQLDEPHHASCYRLYNLWREQRAHQYVAGPAPEALSPAWSEIRAEAQRVTNEVK